MFLILRVLDGSFPCSSLGRLKQVRSPSFIPVVPRSTNGASVLGLGKLYRLGGKTFTDRKLDAGQRGTALRIAKGFRMSHGEVFDV